jgi:hypothetical protein
LFRDSSWDGKSSSAADQVQAENPEHVGNEPTGSAEAEPYTCLIGNQEFTLMPPLCLEPCLDTTKKIGLRLGYQR